jgi:hypothetical protein
MNKISEFIKQREEKSFPLKFKPTIDFYSKTGIKRKRWAMIFRKEISPTIDELDSIAKFFSVTVNDLINL